MSIELDPADREWEYDDGGEKVYKGTNQKWSPPKEDPWDLSDQVEQCDYQTKLAITQWVMKHIVEQAKEGGSYRYLIYDRLGFNMDAYAPLCADGLTISNEFDLNLKSNITEALQKEDYKKIKEILGLCDENNCFEYASSGWPTKDGGYRSTCSDHYNGEIK
jgi:hypothetical protein